MALTPAVHVMFVRISPLLSSVPRFDVGNYIVGQSCSTTQHALILLSDRGWHHQMAEFAALLTGHRFLLQHNSVVRASGNEPCWKAVGVDLNTGYGIYRPSEDV